MGVNRRTLLAGTSACALAVCASLLFATASRAGFPGANGFIAIATPGEAWLLGPPGTRGHGGVLHTIKHPQRLVWSRNGKQLLVTTDTRIYVADVKGRRLHAFPVLPAGGGDAVWTRLGSGIVYVHQATHCPAALVLYTFSDRRRTQLTPCDGAHAPATSPTTPFIAYRGSEEQIKLLNVQSGAIQTVGTRIDGSLTGEGGGVPAWSPDGTELAFSTGRTIVAHNVHSGQDRVIIPVQPTGNYGEPRLGAVAWSPDGQKIAFVRDDPYANDRTLYVANSDGSGIEHYWGGLGVYAPDWQPVPRR